jgi:hypothetical protein
MAWVQSGVCRILFDNHHGKGDHMHKEGVEYPYSFTSFSQLREDLEFEIRKLGGSI